MHNFRVNLGLFKRSQCVLERVFPKQLSSHVENAEKIKQFKEKQLREQPVSPVHKTYHSIKDDLVRLKNLDFKATKPKVPHFSEFVVIGGGMIGSAIAYAMKNRAPDSFEMTVIERDPKYTRASSTLAVGGIRQQFSLEENIKLSLYSAEFLRNVKQHLSVLDDDPPDIQFQPHGYLLLATEEGAAQMIENHKLQTYLGAKVELLNPSALKKKFPWLNVEGIELGSYGIENEGWFDPWALLSAFKKKACSLGTDYVNAEVIGFEFENHSDVRGEEAKPILRTNHVYVKDEVGEVHCIEFANLIIAAGAYSGEVARLLQVDGIPDLHSNLLPVEPRKRYVYVFNCEKGPGLDMPFTIDPTGTYTRREGLGGKYICGRSPTAAEEPDVSNLEVDYNYFENSIWPSLCHRIPAFEGIKVTSAWAGYYDYNTLDQNAIFGPHPYFHNVYLATGFSGHGIQMAAGVGQAMMELLLDQCYVTTNLTRFHIDRVFKNKPLFEKNVF